MPPNMPNTISTASLYKVIIPKFALPVENDDINSATNIMSANVMPSTSPLLLLILDAKYEPINIDIAYITSIM